MELPFTCRTYEFPPRAKSPRDSVSRSSIASNGRPAAMRPTSGSSWTFRSKTCSFTGLGNCTISIERLWLYPRSEEHTSELQSHVNLVCRLLLEKKKKKE